MLEETRPPAVTFFYEKHGGCILCDLFENISHEAYLF